MSWLWLLLGCSGTPPADLVGCAELSSPIAREDCRLRVIEPALSDGSPEQVEAALTALEDPGTRDLVRLRLAVRFPEHGVALCAGVETEPVRAKCRQVVGRPHLAAPR